MLRVEAERMLAAIFSSMAIWAISGCLGGVGAVEDDPQDAARVKDHGALLVAIGVDQALGRCRLGRGEDLADLALFSDGAAVQNGDAGADLLDDAHLVGDDDDGDAQLIVDISDEAKDGLGRLRV